MDESITRLDVFEIRKKQLDDRGSPRLQESQILQSSSEILASFAFLQDSYKFVQESQILQICYNVEHFLQDSDNISAKIALLRKKFVQKKRCVIPTKNLFKTVTFVQFFVLFLITSV